VCSSDLGEDEIPALPNQLQHLPKRIHPGESDYAPTLPDLGVSNNPSQTKPFSNYHRIYEQPRMQPAYYGNVDSSAGTTPIDNRLLEKINYMIHMLEQQQSEKTSNITEEFILYTFLGVFIIFVIDSFARSGKYTR
jgi:Leucine-rich repeat (LRR) protein